MNRFRVTPSSVSRDTVLFCFGLAGILHETLLRSLERPSLLILFGGMVGLPVFLRQDDKKADKDQEAPS